MSANLPEHHLKRRACAAIEAFRAAKPHVHCITNGAAQNFTANVLLAAGAIPSMTIATSEITAFVDMADALLVNLGTLDEERMSASKLALARAVDTGKPSVLDPVFVHGSPPRMAFAKELLTLGPSIIRANEKEAQALLGTNCLAEKQVSLLVITGAEDRIWNGETTHFCGNGDALMDKVTAMGCALSALMAGFAAVEEDPTCAAAGALALFNVAGEVAADWAEGPGTFQPLFLDALAGLTASQIERRAKLS